MNSVTIVVLASSYKPGGRCIAGKLVSFIGGNMVSVGGWVRPVSNDSTGHGAIGEEVYRYVDGAEVRVLDIVEIPILRHNPTHGQPENYIINKNIRWKKVGAFNPSGVINILDNAPSLWCDMRSPSNIVSVEYDQNELISQSLYLIKPNKLHVTLCNNFDTYEHRWKRKIIADFYYRGVHYENLSITCPLTRRILANEYPAEGESPIKMSMVNDDNYALCVSLSPRFGSGLNHYKLVTTIFELTGCLQR